MKFFVISQVAQTLKILVGSTGSLSGKVISTLKLGAILAPFSFITGLDLWYNENSAYVNFVVIAVFLDWVLGTMKHILKLKDFSMKKNLTGVMTKLILVVTLGIIFEGLKYLTIEVNFITKYFMMVLRIAVFMYPGMSIIRSSRVISDNKFPPTSIYAKIENWTSEITKQKTT